MSAETPDKPAGTKADTTEGTPAAPGRRPTGTSRRLLGFTKKQIAVIAAVVGAALAATFTSGLQNLFSGLLPDGWDEPGSGIKVVDVRREPMSGFVLIPDPAAGFDDNADALTSVQDAQWQANNEWYAVGRTTWEITLVGRHRDAVVITDLRPRRTGPCTQIQKQGVLVQDIGQGEGTKIEMKTALDADVPRLTSADDGSAYFDDGTVTLDKGETVIISIEATSAAATCEWVFEADYVDHGERETMTIDAPGDHPFRITGYDESHPYAFTWDIGCARALKPDEVFAPGERPGCK